MLSFFEKKQLGILSSKPSSQILKQKNSFAFFNFVFEVIRWVMIDILITQNLDMKCKIVFRILTTILHSSSSWFAKSDLFRLNSIKNVSLKKTFFGPLHYDLLYCIPKIFFRFSNRIYYKNCFMLLCPQQRDQNFSFLVRFSLFIVHQINRAR